MALFNFGKNEKRAVTWDMIAGDDYPIDSHSGTSVTHRQALKYSVVYAATTLITDAVSVLPPMAYHEREDGSIEKMPLPQWIRSPHREMRRSQVISQILFGSILWGNGTALIARRPSDGIPIGLLPLKPSEVQIDWDPDRPGYKRYKVGGTGNWLTSYDIFDVSGPTLPGEAKGMSLIAQARESIALGLTLEEFGARYFKQGSMAKVLIKSDEKIDDDRAKQLVQIYEKYHRGPSNWHRPAVMAGPGSIENISIPPDDAQFLQSREFQALDVARWFRVPPHRVGIMTKQSSWGSGLAEENMMTKQLTYGPWIMRMEEAYTAYAPGGQGMGLQIRFDDSSLLRGTFSEQVAAWGDAVEKGLATPNEGRVALGLPKMEDEAADKLRDPLEAELKKAEAFNGGKADKAGDLAAPKVKEARYNKFHDKKSGKFTFKPGTTRESLPPGGGAAVDAAMKKYGVSHDGLVTEMKGRITPETIASGKAWYNDAHQSAVDMGVKHGMSTEHAAAAIAATSPRTNWAKNKQLADRVLTKGPEFSGDDPKAAAKKIGGGMSDPISKALRVQRGEEPATVLKGTKVRSFYNNIVTQGAGDDVTVDTWMLRSAMNSTTKPGGLSLDDANDFLGETKSKLTNGNGAGYIAIADATRAVAADLGITPPEAQAAYWIAVRGSAD